MQQAISTMQAEMQDLKSIFKVYFEKGGEPVEASTGEVLTYNSKKTFSYDFEAIKDVLNVQQGVKIVQKMLRFV